MPGDAHLGDGRARGGECADGGADGFVHTRLRQLRDGEAFPDHADPEPGDTGVHFGKVAPRRWVGPLTRVEPVTAGEHFEHQRGVTYGTGDRAEVVEGVLDGKRSCVRHQSVGRLVPDRAAEGAGDPDRAALIAAERHLDVARGDQRCAAAGRPASRFGRVPGIADRTRLGGVAATRKAQVLAYRLAGNRRTSLKHASDDCSVAAGDVSLDRRGPVHHWQPGNLDVVLDRYRPPRQRAAAARPDFGRHVPGAQLVVGFAGPLIGSAGRLGKVRLGTPRCLVNSGETGSGLRSQQDPCWWGV